MRFRARIRNVGGKRGKRYAVGIPKALELYLPPLLGKEILVTLQIWDPAGLTNEILAREGSPETGQ